MSRERWFRGDRGEQERRFDWAARAREFGVPEERAWALYEEAMHRAGAHRGDYWQGEAIYVELLEEARLAAWQPAPGKVTRTMRLAAERAGHRRRPRISRLTGQPIAPGKRTLTSYLQRPAREQERPMDGESAEPALDEAALQAQVDALGLALDVAPEALAPRIDDEAQQRTEARRSSGLMEGGSIYLHPERYDPFSRAGRYLLAHEAAHLAQRRLSPEESTIADHRAAEAEAHAIGEAFAAGRPVSRPRVALAPAAVAADTGDRDEAAWRAAQEDGEPSTPVGKPARIGGPDLTFGSQKRIYDRPDDSGPPSGHLTFDTPVWVERENTRGWCYVYAASGTAGWVQKTWVAMDPPEPGATLHPIAPGETLEHIAARYYKGKEGFVWGADARLFVDALVQANEMAGRQGIYRVEAELSFWEELIRSEKEERTLRIWRSARVVAGHCIWIPSPAFVRQLAASGAIGTHGGSASHALWSQTREAAGQVWDWAQLGAGFAAGLVRGALESVWDLLAGIPELVVAVGKLLKSLFTGHILQDARALWESLRQLDLRALEQAFLAQWNAPDPWQQGLFRGRVCGYVLTEVALMVFSGGIATALKAAGIFGRIATLLSKATSMRKLAARLQESKELLEFGERIRRALGKSLGANKQSLPKTFCFPKGTQVVTASGLAPIEGISPGEVVKSFDFSTGEIIDAVVVDVSASWTERLIGVDLGDHVVWATPRHAFWIEGAQQWLEAEHLSAGMSLRLMDGHLRVIGRIHDEYGLCQVHNLEIRGTHNFYVTDLGVLVHNGGSDIDFDDFNQARNAALRWLEERGFKAEKQVLSKMRKDPNFGRPIGMSTKDGRVGFRVEFDPRNGPHINVFSGREKGPHFRFEGTQTSVNKIIKQFLCH